MINKLIYKGQRFQPLRWHSAASPHFKTPGGLGFAGASPNPPGFFAVFHHLSLTPIIFSTGFFASKFLNAGLHVKTGALRVCWKKISTLSAALRGRIFFRKVLPFSPSCSGQGAYKKPPEASAEGDFEKHNGYGHTEKQGAPGTAETAQTGDHHSKE